MGRFEPLPVIAKSNCPWRHDTERAMTAAQVPTIAIVGAGFSGSLLAVHLTRQSVGPLEIIMIDRNGSRGRGLAYSAHNPNHLLNVRVENMSAFPDLPGHFRDWLERRIGRPADALAFVSRGLYGSYVEDVLSTALGRADGQVAITQIAASCVDLRQHDGGWTLVLSDGRLIKANAVALCLGHFPPRLPVAIEAELGADPRTVADPWNLKAYARIKSRDRVIVIGSGLTMADVSSICGIRAMRGRSTSCRDAACSRTSMRGPGSGRRSLVRITRPQRRLRCCVRLGGRPRRREARAWTGEP
jgi:uncharacterized NAD(P)/FAD-binding protein YdhS